jgi:hypothetical protein
VVLIAGTGEYFHHDRIADREVVGEEAIDGLARRGTGIAEELDPG